MPHVITNNKEDLAAIIIEPLVQCAGGFKFHDDNVLKFISNIAKENNILFIVDEIATGFGRTGKMFACEHEGVIPDLMCLAKGLSGGYLPLAVTMTKESIFKAFLGNKNNTFYYLFMCRYLLKLKWKLGY